MSNTSVSTRIACQQAHVSLRQAGKRVLGFVIMLVLLTALACSASAQQSSAPATVSSGSFVSVIDMDMMILPGTLTYLDQALQNAAQDGAKAVVVVIDTPGGMLQTAQEIVQLILRSPVPVIVYVGPSGATATSAGVFITLAGHVAAMAPGTTIGAATPVMGDGQNIPTDMKAKAENMTSAMVRSIAEQRGRNVQWAERAVKEAASLTESEALKQEVVDLVAGNIDELLRKVKGKAVRVNDKTVTLEDLSALPRAHAEIATRDYVINVLSNPTVLALLWLIATTGISIELYNPGLIVPGTVGVISLLIALAMNQVIPVNSAAALVMGFGAVLIGAELYTGTILLGVLGLIALVLGAVYLVDVGQAPGLEVALEVIIPVALLLGSFMVLVSLTGYRVMRRTPVTGKEGLVGLTGKAMEAISSSGQVYVNGEYWNATVKGGVIERGAEVEVVAMLPGLILEVRPRIAK